MLKISVLTQNLGHCPQLGILNPKFCIFGKKNRDNNIFQQPKFGAHCMTRLMM